MGLVNHDRSSLRKPVIAAVVAALDHDAQLRIGRNNDLMSNIRLCRLVARPQTTHAQTFTRAMRTPVLRPRTHGLLTQLLGLSYPKDRPKDFAICHRLDQRLNRSPGLARTRRQGEQATPLPR